jgi:hypothetical protein
MMVYFNINYDGRGHLKKIKLKLNLYVEKQIIKQF